MKREDIVIPAVIWAVATLAAIGVTAIFMDPFPTKGSEEAEFVEEAFIVMTYMAAPVFGLIIAALSYNLLRHRRVGTPEEDGPPVHGTNWVPRAWLGITTLLAVTVMIFPGLTGLADIRGDDTADMDINVRGFQWSWVADYVGTDVRVSGTSGELVLPAETRIRFNITSDDVLHSFWIPAFGPKIDAVPGITTQLYITTLEPGSPETDQAGYRLQCAELCGLSHSDMVMPVRVLEREEFETWLETAGAAAAETPVAGVIVASSIGEWFVTAEPPAVAAGGVNFEVTNDGAVPHEFVVIRTDLAADALPTTGGQVDESQVEVIGRTAQLLSGEGANVGADLAAGAYALICNIPGHYDLGMRTGFTVE